GISPPVRLHSGQDFRSTWHLRTELFQNLRDSFLWVWIRCDRSTYDKVVRAGFQRLTRSHRSLLVARFRAVWTNPGDNDLDLVTKFTAKRFDFVGAGNDSIDSLGNT